MEELICREGTIHSVIFQNAENGYTVLRLLTEEGEAEAKKVIQSIAQELKVDPVDFTYELGEEEVTVITVEDNGIGIPAHELPRVFDRGFTGSNGRNRGGSTGMGLYLCKKLAGFLELGLEIASEEGKGTTVTLTFPAKENLTKL